MHIQAKRGVGAQSGSVWAPVGLGVGARWQPVETVGRVPTLEVMASEGAPEAGAAGSTTLAPARPEPDLDDGDHDRMAHIVLEGYSPKDGEFVSTGPSVVEGIVTGTAVRALCGKEWVPGHNPARYGLCPTCKEIAEAMGWNIPSS
jgi:hypothetical protein